MGESQAQQLEEALELLEEKEDLIAELTTRNEQLQAEGGGGGGGGGLGLHEELRELRGRLEQAENALEKARDGAKEQESRAKELDAQNKILQVDKLRLETELQKAEEQAEQMDDAVQSMRQRSEQAAESEDRLGAREKSHKKTLIKALEENEQLRKDVARLDTDVKTLYEAMQEKEEANVRLQQEAASSAQDLHDSEHEIVELRKLLAEKDKELASAQDEISAVTDMETDIEGRVKLKVEKWKSKVKALQDELNAETKGKLDLQKRCDALMQETGVKEVESQLIAAEEANMAFKHELEESKALLAQSHDDLVQLAKDNEALKADQGKFIDVALEKERQELERLREVIQRKDELIEEERMRYRELEEHKANLEEELQDRELTMAEYERGHGLEEAVLKQKKLRGEVKRREKEIRRLNQQLSDRISAHEKLYETCRRLKKKANLPESFQFDELELQEGMKGQTERLQALIKEMKSQNEALEDERLRLLEALRQNAVNFGEQGIKHLGLAAEQVVHVNKFVENLRDGRVELPLDDKSLQLKEEIRELKHRLRETERDLHAAELQLENGGEDPLSSPRSSLRSPKHVVEYEKRLKRMEAEQQRMMDEIKEAISRALATQGDLQHSSNALSPKNPPGDPAYAKLIQMLQDKLQGSEKAELGKAEVKTMREELERQSELNEELTRRLRDSESMLEILRSRSPTEPADIGADGIEVADCDSRQLVAKARTRIGKQFLEEQLSGLRLPPEEWAEPFVLLYNRLTACMEELTRKDHDVREAAIALREHEQNMSMQASQMGLLYCEFAQAKEKWQAEVTKLQVEADEARNERDSLRAKARRLDTLCAVLDGDDADVRVHAKELTRRVAVLEVNEVVLARRYNLLFEEEKALRFRNDSLNHELVQAETALRERVLYLEEWKAEAQEQLENLQLTAKSSVPRPIHDHLLQKLATVNHKYREALGREASLHGKSGGAQALRRRVHELESDLEMAKLDLAKARHEVNASDNDINGNGWRSGDELTPERLVAQLKGELVEKDIILASAKKKVDILEKRAEELTQEVERETNRADSSETALESAREMINRLESERSRMEGKFSGGASAEERKVLEDRIKELERMYSSRAREVIRHRELADIASAQVQMLEGIQQSRQLELDELHRQLRNVNARSDDDAIIGKLQHELTNTKVSYQMFVQKFGRAKAAIRRNELRIKTLEEELDQKHGILLKTSEESRIRILALEQAFERLGAPEFAIQDKDEKLLAFTGFLPGASLGTMERLSETIARLGRTADHAEEALRRSEHSRRNLEAELEAARLEADSLRSTLEDLEAARMSESSPSAEIAKRLLDLNEELRVSRLEAARRKRELELLGDEKQHIEMLRAKDEEHIRRVEETLAGTEKALRRYEDERRLVSVESSKREDLALIDFNENGRRRGGSKDNRLEEERRERFEVEKKHLEEISDLQKQLRRIEMQENELRSQLQSRDRKIEFLRRKLEAEGISIDGAVQADEFPSERTNHYEMEARKLQTAAQQTIASLKDIVARKNQAIDGLKRKLEAEREKALAERQRDQAEIERLTEKLYEDNREAIGKLRSAYEDIANGRVPDMQNGEDSTSFSVHKELMERLEEADALIERKDRRILELEGVFEELRVMREKAEQRVGQSAEVAESLREKMKRMIQDGDDHGQLNLVKQLRGQLRAKDKKLAGLRSAVLALKNEFIKVEEEHEEELIKRDREIKLLGSQEGGKKAKITSKKVNSPISGGQELQKQLESMKERIDRAHEELSESKQGEKMMENENKNLRIKLQDLEEKREKSEAEGNIRVRDRKLLRQMEQLRRENRRLRANDDSRGGEESKENERSFVSVKGEAAEAVKLEKRVKVLEAQNAALRSAANSGSVARWNANASISKWESDKKLEKKVESLTRKLEEQKRLTEASKQQSDQAKQLLERISKQQHKTPNGSQLGLRRGVEDQRREMDELKMILQELRRRADVEQIQEIARLQQDLRAAEARTLELEEELDALRSRRRHKESTADSLRVAEQQYAKEDQLRAELGRSRKEVRALEADLLERDNVILEIRFDLEQEKNRQDSAESAALAKRSRGPGDRVTKREQDLENVVSSMKRVVNKLQAENDRLRKGKTTGNSNHSELSKKLRKLREENAALEAERDACRTKAKEAVEESAKAIRLNDALRSTRNQAREMEARVKRLEKENRRLMGQRSNFIMPEVDSGSAAAEPFGEESHNGEIMELRNRISRQEETIAGLRQDITADNEVEELREENKKLLGELNAFDLDFFEEIEDLKFKYHQLLEENQRLRRNQN